MGKMTGLLSCGTLRSSAVRSPTARRARIRSRGWRGTRPPSNGASIAPSTSSSAGRPPAPARPCRCRRSWRWGFQVRPGDPAGSFYETSPMRPGNRRSLSPGLRCVASWARASRPSARPIRSRPLVVPRLATGGPPERASCVSCATADSGLEPALHELQRLQAARLGRDIAPPAVVDVQLSTDPT